MGINEEFGFDDDMDEGIDLGMEMCEDCSINPAIVHLTHVERNEAETFHLCEDCARRRGVPVPDGEALLKGIEALVSGGAAMFGDSHVKVTVKQIGGVSAGANAGGGSSANANSNAGAERREEEDAVCPGCRIKLSEFRARGRLGCAKCYNSFDKQICAVLKQVHGADGHMGKRYESAWPRGGKGVVGNGDLDRLRHELSEAVSGQRFEQAAVIRDTIRSLEYAK